MRRFASAYAGWTAGLLALSVLTAGPARTQETPEASACCGLTTAAPGEFKRFYAGAAFNWTHHTGSIPDKPVGYIWNGNAKQYTAGGKAFVGYRFNEYVHFEATYHYL